MAGRLTFHDDTHTYVWEEGALRRPLVSVTQALEELGFYDASRYRSGAAERGTAIHEATVEIDRGPWLPELEAVAVAEDYGAAAADAYQRFRTAYQPTWLLIEQPLADPQRGFAGTPDRYGTLVRPLVPQADPGSPGVLDLKSGSAEPWHTLQVAAYAHLLRVNGYPCQWGALLYLRTERLVPVSLDLIASALVVISAAHVKRSMSPRRTPRAQTRIRPEPPDFD